MQDSTDRKILVDFTNPEISFFPMYVGVVSLTEADYLRLTKSEGMSVMPEITEHIEISREGFNLLELTINEPDMDQLVYLMGKFRTRMGSQRFDLLDMAIQECNNGVANYREHMKMLLVHAELCDMMGCDAVYLTYS